MTCARAGPSPNTVCVACSYRWHARQLLAASRTDVRLRPGVRSPFRPSLGSGLRSPLIEFWRPDPRLAEWRPGPGVARLAIVQLQGPVHVLGDDEAVARRLLD